MCAQSILNVVVQIYSFVIGLHTWVIVSCGGCVSRDLYHRTCMGTSNWSSYRVAWLIMETTYWSTVCSQRRCYGLPTMHCFQWVVLYMSPGSLVMKDTLVVRSQPNLAFWVGFVTNNPTHMTFCLSLVPSGPKCVSAQIERVNKQTTTCTKYPREAMHFGKATVSSLLCSATGTLKLLCSEVPMQ